MIEQSEYSKKEMNAEQLINEWVSLNIYISIPLSTFNHHMPLYTRIKNILAIGDLLLKIKELSDKLAIIYGRFPYESPMLLIKLTENIPDITSTALPKLEGYKSIYMLSQISTSTFGVTWFMDDEDKRSTENLKKEVHKIILRCIAEQVKRYYN